MSDAIEARLQAVEKELAELKILVERGKTSRPWYEPLIGSMKDYPEFEEVVRLGREARMVQRDYLESPE